ncbi:MAG: glycosyltransferase family 4 protein [Candidatus Aenigmarchaeota archaeon]|nr:glycosyltransferase family 4 protein [Candidatus Aenigmarchaeota archaeon]
MKILHVCNHFYPNVGGIETYIRELSKNLIDLGHQSDVLCLDTKYNGKNLPREEIIDGIKVMRTGCIDLKLYKLAPHVLKYVKGYDIIHVHAVSFFSDFFSLTKPLHKKALVLSTHGGIFHTKKIMPLKNAYFFGWEKTILKNFDKVLAHSINDRELFSKIVPENKIDLIPYSLYIKDYDINRKFTKNSMLFVGRLEKNKRIDRLIRVLKNVSETIDDATLVLVGGYLQDDKELLSLAQYVGVDKKIISLGPKYGKDLINCYASYNIFVSAAEYEGFGISVLEAMAAGCPVVVNDIRAFRNFVENGKTGYITDFSDEKKTADLIIKVLASDLSSVSENAKRYIEAYDWPTGVKRALKAYNEILDK